MIGRPTSKAGYTSAVAGILDVAELCKVQPALEATEGPLTCVFPLLAPGDSVDIKFTMKAKDLPVGASVGTIFHQATVKPAETENMTGIDVLANNSTADRTSTSRTPRGIDLGLDKQGPAGPLDEGDSATYTLTVTSYGSKPSPAGEVTDVLPQGLEYVSASPECQYDSATRTVRCAVSTLGRGETKVFTLETKLEKPYKGSRPLVNKASVTVPGDEDPGNDTDEVRTPLKPGPDGLTGIPTLSEWGVMLLSLLLGLLAWRKLPVARRW